jgi:hypothetical protein
MSRFGKFLGLLILSATLCFPSQQDTSFGWEQLSESADLPKTVLRLKPVIGMPYQGRIVGIYKDRRDKRDFNYLGNYGEDFRALTFWKRAIPTLDDYGPAVSPRLTFLVQNNDLDLDQNQLRNQLFFPKFDPEILSSLGVRMIFSDLEYSGLPYDKIMLKDEEVLRSYILENTNIRGYFVNTVINNFPGSKQQKVAKVTELLRSRRAALIEGELVDRAPQDLSLGKWSRVTYLSAGFRVEAKGEGNSLLLLPFEYSSCLKIKENTSHRKLAIGPTNLLQTGVVFDRKLDIEIKFTTGIFVNPFCRLEDAKTFKEGWVD